MRVVRPRSVILVLLTAFAPAWAAEDAAKDRLAQVQGLDEKDGKYAWAEQGAPSLPATDVDGDKLMLELEGVKVSVPLDFIGDHRADLANELPALAKAAKAGGLSGPLEADITGLTGPLLRSEQAVVVQGKVLKLGPGKTPDRSRERDGIAAAATKMDVAIKASGMNVEAQQATVEVIDKLALPDGKYAMDEVDPFFARCLVRNGWMAQIGFKPTDPAVTALKQAMAVAEKLASVRIYSGGEAAAPTSYTDMRDSFGHGGWVLSSPTKVSFGIPSPEPMFLAPYHLELVVDLPPKSDPTGEIDKATGARLYKHGKLIASWDGKTLTADMSTWRTAIPGGTGNVAANLMPPHIAVCCMNGERRRLVVHDGVVVPPKDGSMSEVNRFLGEAAKTLPDTASLDLVGEYLFRYVYDSPDPKYMPVIGNKSNKGDIHQTAAQTVGRVVGGIMCGDCDDAAELYLTLREKQGGLGHVALLPSHAACLYATKEGDQWATNLLQTGPPLIIKADKLPDALKSLYLSFDQAAAFDPNGVNILLRFSGENTRGPWRLSWRIFAEPEYSKTMVDVQRDWHYETYERGISAMTKMIENGDKDPANYRELAGLANFTGQYALAAEYNQKAIDVTEDPVSKLQMNMEQVGHLYDAGKKDESKALLEDVIAKQIPGLRQQLAGGVLNMGFEAIGTAMHIKDYDLANRTCKEIIAAPCDTFIKQLVAYIQSPQFNEQNWENAQDAQTLRRITHEYAMIATGLLREVGKDAALKDQVYQFLVQDAGAWLTFIAFRDGDDDGDWLQHYAELGQFHRFLFGDQALLEKLDKAEFPKTAKRDHAKRGTVIDSPQQLADDLPWIKVSPMFWMGLIGEKFDKDKESVDVAEVKRLAKNLVAAADACKKLGLSAPEIDEQAHLGTLVLALLEQDAKTVKERLAFVAKENDKRLRDSTAQWLGVTARVLDDAWYGKVIDLWKQEVDYKPKWLGVAWVAALNKAPKLALAVAKRAADEYKDDAAFREEYDFMRQLLEKSGGAKDAPPDKKSAAP
jgi:hypothetical protein